MILQSMGGPLDTSHTRYVNDLWTRSWFKRVWVQQEHILNWQVTLHCGKSFVGHEGILRFWQDLTRYSGGWEW